MSRAPAPSRPEETLDVEIIVRFVTVPFEGICSLGAEIAEVKQEIAKPPEGSSEAE